MKYVKESEKIMKLKVDVRGLSSFSFELFSQLAPLACSSVVNIAHQGLYNGRRVERLEPGFVLQPLFFDGVDPVLDASLELEAKTLPANRAYRFERGTVAMAGTANSASAAQFFITLAPAERLNGNFTVIGQITSGWSTIEQIERMPVAEGVVRDGEDVHTYHYPVQEVVIDRVTVLEST